MKNFKGTNPNLNEYYEVLSKDIPDFLYKYVDTPAMQKQAGISVTCGTIYSKMFNHKFWYSSLEHSIAVALIIWHFTEDKKQSLSGLFHDIATPVFKHSIDFMNGDYENQESTEELTTKIIRESKEIMELLKRDGIKLEEVDDYHIYPIADNDTPNLSADRLEYTLSNGLGATEELWNLDKIRKIYNDIEIQRNEYGIEELGFKNVNAAEEFVHTMSKLSRRYRINKVKFTMQFLADIMKKMSARNLITIEDMYTLSEKEVIDKIEKCDYDNISECFKIWKNVAGIHESDTAPENRYSVGVKSKIRYIVPLVRINNKFVRIDKISKNAKDDIETALNFTTKKYAWLDFNF